MSRPWPGTPNERLSPILTCWLSREVSGAPSSRTTSAISDRYTSRLSCLAARDTTA